MIGKQNCKLRRAQPRGKAKQSKLKQFRTGPAAQARMFFYLTFCYVCQDSVSDAKSSKTFPGHSKINSASTTFKTFSRTFKRKCKCLGAIFLTICKSVKPTSGSARPERKKELDHSCYFQASVVNGGSSLESSRNWLTQNWEQTN